MLHIFLVILKIIGILLATAAGILVLLILCILFWPVRYYIAGQYREEWKVRAGAGFLGPLVRLSFWYEQEAGYRLRVLGIPVWGSKKKAEKTVRKQKKDTKAARQKTAERQSVPDETEKCEETQSEVLEKEKPFQEQIEKENSFESREQSGAEHLEENFLRRFWKKIRRKAEGVADAARNISRYLRRLKELYEDEGVRTGFSKVKAEIRLLVKRIKPKKMKGYLRIGFEDPANTGQFLAVLAVLPWLWEQDIQIEPDFEHKILETDVRIKGFIRGSYFLRIAWKCLFDEEVKYLFNKVKFKEE